MTTKRVTWLGLLISVTALVLIALEFDLSGTLDAIRLAKPGWLVLAALVYTVQFPLRGLRWSILLRDIKRVSPQSATEVFTIGFLANNVLPLRLGDVARAFVLAKREGVAASATFSNVLLERVFDGLTVAGILGLVFVFDPPQAAWVTSAGLATAGIFLCAVTAAAITAWNERRALALAKAILSFLPGKYQTKLLALVEKLAKGLATLRSPRATLQVVLLSIVIWCAEVAVYLIAQRAFGLELSFIQLSLVMAVLTFGLMAPSGPGFFGVYEGLVIAALAVYGVGEPLAPALAITMHAIHFVPGTLLGLFFTWKNGLRLRELKSVAAPQPVEAEGAAEASLR